jgi:uncharacterized membrane protein
MKLNTKTPAAPSFGKKVVGFFLQGLIVIAPVGITVAVVLWLFTTIDNFLPQLIIKYFPHWEDEIFRLKKLPGIGFLSAILLILFIGWLSSLFLVGRMVDVLDTVLQRTPGINFIYSAVKDFFEAFAGNNKKFDKPVLVNLDGADVWRIGFITNTQATAFGLENYVSVYVPHSYAVSGITYIVSKEKIKPLTEISGADAMKFVVSGGVTDLS